MYIQTLVGQPSSSADGTQPQLRSGRMGDLITSPLHAHHYETTARGNVFSAQLASTSSTIAAGNINSAAAGASTQFALFNPLNSGVYLSLLKVYVAAISGTAPGGPVNHSYSVGGTPAGTVGFLAGISNLIGSGGRGKGQYLASAAGASLTGMTNALITLRPMNINFFAGALTAGSPVNWALEECHGDVVIAPGGLWVPTWSAAGTTFLNAYGVTWEEIPI
jgi:hypothetical protein